MAKPISIFILTISLYKLDCYDNIIIVLFIIYEIMNKVHVIREINVQCYCDTPDS